MIKRDEIIKIGQFNKPHGLDGEISFTFTDDIFDREDSPYIVCPIDGIFVPFFIEEYRFRSDNMALVKLIDIDSAEKARMFTNLDVYYPKKYIKDEEAFTTGKDFFLDYTVFDIEYGKLGVITSIDDSTANVLFVIEDDNEEVVLVPAVDEFVESIDNDKKEIHLKLPHGFLHINS
ncbi:MAG: ribosome maturation factor RimM [Bacteroidales bacterium]|nr:ribosome maturation factor RimM [Bacteroidales bacterium]